VVLGRGERAVGGRDARQVIRRAPERIEQVEVHVGIEQAATLVLAVTLEQPLAELAQDRDRGRRAVDEGACRAADLAPHDDLVAVGVETARLERRADAGAPRSGLDDGPVRASAHERHVGALSGAQPKASTRIDFPAPVSPVSTLSPGAKSTSRSSIVTRFRMRSVLSIGRRFRGGLRRSRE
jgi:hypothetical protein